MVNIAVTTLNLNLISSLFNSLSPKETEIILGGSLPDEFSVINTSDNLYIGTVVEDKIFSVGAYSKSVSNNTYHTLDDSRSIYNTFVYKKISK